MEAKTSNYERTKHKMQELFLENDLDQVAAEWELRQDPSAIYLTFLSTPCAIDRQSGAVIFARDGVRQEADFNVSMTIFDILSRPRARASGEYMPVSWFSDMQTSTVLAGSFFDRSAKQLAGRTSRLAEVCRQLGGTPWGKGDAAYLLPVFRDFRVAVQFWDADEEFPAQLNFYCDRNLPRFMHYETMMFLLSHIAHRLCELTQ